MGKGKAEGCAACAKWCLIIFNVLFCLIGLAMVAAGAWAYATLSDYLALFENKMVNAPAIVLIVFGCITFIIAAIGCIGACKESPCLLFTFAVVIGILLIAEVVAGIVAFVYQDKIKEFIGTNADDLIKKYNASEKGENVATDTYDLIQEKLECCGVNDPADYTKLGMTIPASCAAYTTGCVDALINFTTSNIYVVGGVGIGLGLVQLLGIVLACCVGCAARKGEYA